jgi:hypothetical protein
MPEWQALRDGDDPDQTDSERSDCAGCGDRLRPRLGTRCVMEGTEAAAMAAFGLARRTGQDFRQQIQIVSNGQGTRTHSAHATAQQPPPD